LNELPVHKMAQIYRIQYVTQLLRPYIELDWS